MKRKEIARLLDPSQHIYSKAWLDPFRPTPDRPLAPRALHNEIRRRLLAGEAVDSVELARNYAVDEVMADRAVYYEEGRFSEYDRTLGVDLAKEIRRLLKAGKQVSAVRLSAKFGMSRHNTKRLISEEKVQFATLHKRMQQTTNLIRDVAESFEYFTSDNVYELMDKVTFADPQAKRGAESTFGPCIVAAEKKGICEKTDQRITTKRPSYRGRKLTVWRSLIWEGKPIDADSESDIKYPPTNNLKGVSNHVV